DEVMKLGLDKSIRVGIGILEGYEGMETWSANSTPNGKVDLKMGMLDMTIHPMLIGLKKAWKSGKSCYSYDYIGDDVFRYYQALNNEPEYPFQADLDSLPENEYHKSFFYNEGILFSFAPNPISEEAAKVLARFASVFGQTYRRYLDLQKAEQQAKEAQIEAALEKVRASSMAMHKSEELKEVIQVVYDQFSQLNINIEHTGFIMDYKENEDMHIWLADKKAVFPEIKLPYFDCEHWNSFKKAKKKGDNFFTNLLGFEEKNKFYQDLFKFIPESPKEVKDHYLSCPGLAISTVLLDNVGLYIENFQGVPYSDEDNSILMRFGKVFQQTYTRFLDLQKAEAQAREAQIETALEKVRASSMAMHKSEQLPETAQVLFEQFALLGNLPDRISICIIKEDENLIELWATDQIGSQLDHRYSGSLEESTTISKIHKAWKEGKESIVIDLSGQKLKDWVRYIKEDVRLPIDDSKIKGRRVQQAAFFSKGLLLCTTNEPVADETMELLIRFAKVFDQTYTRFLDLQKAEAQAREAQIEFALERVRAKALAMHSSEELIGVSLVLREQMAAIGQNQLETIAIHFIPEDNSEFTAWFAFHPPDSEEGEIKYGNVEFDNNETYYAREFMRMFRSQERNYLIEASGEHLIEWQEMLLARVPVFKELWKNQIPNHQYWYFSDFSGGNLMLITLEEASKEALELLRRSAQVFDLAYRRYLDLQKAESQAREARIEAALERVRAASMAMHKTDELAQVVMVLFQQFSELELDFYQVWINIFIIEEGYSNCWFSPVEGVIDEVYTARVPLAPFEESSIKSWRAGEEFSYLSWRGLKEVDEITKSLSEMTGHESFIRIQKKKRMDRMEIVDSNHKYGVLAMAKNNDITDNDRRILKRFSKVFEQTYTRFLDLQNAESQAREAQIEVALERVRSRAMAMHHTDELTDVLGVLFDQFDFLGINPALTHLTLFDEANETFTLRITTGGKKRVIAEQLIDVNAVESWKTSFANWKKSELHAVDCIDYPPEILPAVWELLDEVMSALPEGQKLVPEDFPDGLYTTQGHCKYGFIGFNHSRRATEEEKEIVVRFAKEFGRLYQRFLDLQKAETQTREAQIEIALERVRSRTMAMHRSEELSEVAYVLFEELKGLGVQLRWCWFSIFDEDLKGMKAWYTDTDGQFNPTSIHQKFKDFKDVKFVFKAWKNNDPICFNEIKGPALVAYVNELGKNPDFRKGPTYRTFKKEISGCLYQTHAIFKQGYLGYSSFKPRKNETLQFIERFAKSFEQTYTRFLDLQKAEAQAKEATKQASLDRVRGQIASMRTAADLERITPLVWNELTTMNVPFIRCGVFIIDEPTEIVEVYLSAPDGHSLGVLHLQFNANPITANTVAHWRKGSIFNEHWNREEFISWTRSLMEQGQISNKNTYQGAANPPESLNLHFIPFTQGMLYVGSENPLNNEQIELVQSLADTFAIAYARYEDFTKLEKAKQSVETTLSELKTTQNQLVQSEKMASLGELTAGIAHEIQNPLNFVNNFSEVSVELIEEMHQELEKGDLKEALAIAEDVKQNLDKITHHGKRADGIVKGMLQHSRSSSGQKEPTDINVLADEYLRLAYHGLRAKDKTFNATMETDFDEGIGKVNIIPQDIGRVILNLITNAFYACAERSRSATNEKSSFANLSSEALEKLEASEDKYKPTVSVSTKKKGEQVLISVKDNGNGIPKKVLAKIFQPFFTTKPTGQGTGLGLSMSYDIVKAHGGELKVETKEGEGTEFIVTIPQN
ncbi:MAG: ATP-binding protein, partial [Eudoraea sp.]|uniref:sensor histidine kinase n=1 Tax=Eudoraea sp. TaxID=1979955 RepID=UPI003C76B609